MILQHPGPPGDANPVMMIIGPVIFIALLVLYVFMARYTYKDSMKRGLNAEMWLLIVLLVPVFSNIVYFLVRNEQARLNVSTTTPATVK